MSLGKPIEVRNESGGRVLMLGRPCEKFVPWSEGKVEGSKNRPLLGICD